MLYLPGSCKIPYEFLWVQSASRYRQPSSLQSFWWVCWTRCPKRMRPLPPFPACEHIIQEVLGYLLDRVDVILPWILTWDSKERLTVWPEIFVSILLGSEPGNEVPRVNDFLLSLGLAALHSRTLNLEHLSGCWHLSSRLLMSLIINNRPTPSAI